MGSEQSFFEKKDQKAFARADADLSGLIRDSTDQSFLLLFLEKEDLALLPMAQPPGRLVSGADNGPMHLLTRKAPQLYFALPSAAGVVSFHAENRSRSGVDGSPAQSKPGGEAGGFGGAASLPPTFLRSN
jgi:hypothetical protein